MAWAPRARVSQAHPRVEPTVQRVIVRLSLPSPPPKPGHGHKKNSSSGDVLSDLTSGMMGMGVGKKQGTGTPMKAGGARARTLPAFSIFKRGENHHVARGSHASRARSITNLHEQDARERRERRHEERARSPRRVIVLVQDERRRRRGRGGERRRLRLSLLRRSLGLGLETSRAP